MTTIRKNAELFFQRLALQLLRHRIKTLLVVMMIFIALALNLGRLTADVTTEGFLHKNDPSLKAYEKFKYQFGNDDLIIIAIESENIHRFQIHYNL